jgi:nitrile hydratase subunit beta
MPALPKDMVAIAIKSGASARAEVKASPRFKAGDKVVARNINPPKGK